MSKGQPMDASLINNRLNNRAAHEVDYCRGGKQTPQTLRYPIEIHRMEEVVHQRLQPVNPEPMVGRIQCVQAVYDGLAFLSESTRHRLFPALIHLWQFLREWYKFFPTHIRLKYFGYLETLRLSLVYSTTQRRKDVPRASDSSP
jgi:hypothetical protein